MMNKARIYIWCNKVEKIVIWCKIFEENMKVFLIKEYFMGFIHTRKITGTTLHKITKFSCSKSELVLIKQVCNIFYNISRNLKVITKFTGKELKILGTYCLNNLDLVIVKFSYK